MNFLVVSPVLLPLLTAALTAILAPRKSLQRSVSLLGALPEPGQYDALVVAVAHEEFKQLGIDGLRRLANGRAVIYDIKGIFGKDDVDGRL